MKVCLSCRAGFHSQDWSCPNCGAQAEHINGYPVLYPRSTVPEDGFKAEYFARLAGIEAANFWFRSRNRLILWAVERYFSGAENFLEIGCGTGFVLSAIKKKFPSLSLYGSDIYAEGLNCAKERAGHLSLMLMDARAIPYENEFDLIGAFDILEHVKEEELVLSQIHKSLRKGGGMLLTVPQHPFLWSRSDEAACHLRRYHAAQLKAKVEKTGFRILKMTSFVSLLLPLMILARLWEKHVRREKYDVMRSLEFNWTVDILMEKVLDFERFLVQKGVSFPFGGSLFLIARRT
ncbi:MAG: class I SAM-dependent methyltransferase [Candidatus Omnitrophota bacterium]